ncbi:DUF262 domain-containing protein [Metamycoplasma hominis]|uniref:DUF262 domain-containing protein n=1 Tax=Metamycoplasma hominis TaxID=2098 RepID=UPI001939EE7E|nr:DUF262 domain-containing protein [Metamycoplasma hominis]
MKYETTKNIEYIFQTYKVINVPYYQREYVWSKKNRGQNLYKFIDDIFSQYDCSGGEKDYFIGTLAFCDGDDKDVIDGQQRITSLILILNVLANEKCSLEIKEKNNKLIQPDDKFIIQESHYLTEELKYNFGLPNNFNTQGDKADIADAISLIKNQINNKWNDKNSEWYDNLYKYILEKVNFILITYNNTSESLKYFLNINSLSIKLTQKDIFFSILSESLKISNRTENIFEIKNQIKELGEKEKISIKINEYKSSYDSDGNQGMDNIIYIFLNAFYQNDQYINELNETGIGRWIALYKNEIFRDQVKASQFIEKFIDYLKDFKIIYCNLFNSNANVNPKSHLFISSILLKTSNASDTTLIEVISDIFKIRHNYIENMDNCNLNLYGDENKDIDIEKLNEISKRLNLTLFCCYIKGEKFQNFTNNISLDVNGNYKKSIIDIINDITWDAIFNLNYNDKKNVDSNSKISDKSKEIKIILAIQQSFLSWVAKPENEISEYLNNILSGNFTIEHLYSTNEYRDSKRLENWKNKGKFKTSQDFDIARFAFLNLSLLDGVSNAKANDEVIYDKIQEYKQANRIFGFEPEYLIQSLVKDSKFYEDDNIRALNLPNRTIKNIEQNTWYLDPEINRKFNIKLLKKAFAKIFNVDINLD